MKKNVLLLMALMLCCVNEINAQVEAGLPVPLALKSGISSKNLSKGDVIPFVVSAEVYDSSGDLVIPEGSLAYGSVSSKTACKCFGKAGTMEIQIDYVSLSDGLKVPLTSDTLMAKGKTNKITRTLGYIGCFWLVTLPCAFVKGGPAVLEEGTAVQAFTK